jgi:hypothetical protein
MTTFLSRFKLFGAALVLAAGLGAVSMAPAVAQDAPPSGFSLGIPENGAPLPFGSEPNTGRSEMSTEDSSRRGGYYDPGPDDFDYCLNDRQILRGLRDYGFERVKIVRYLRGERVEATAYWGRSQYSMRIDRCTGVVDRVRLLRRSGFGLQFNFSN